MVCQILRMGNPRKPRKARSDGAKWLIKLRTDLGLKQTELSELLGYSRSLVGMIETDGTPLQEEFKRRIAERYPDAPEAPSEDGGDVKPLILRTAENASSHVYMAYAGEIPGAKMAARPSQGARTMKVPAGFDGEGRFSCKVLGSKGHPFLQQGDLTSWEEDAAPPHGCFVLVRVDEDSPAFLAEMLTNGDGPLLAPIREGEVLPSHGKAFARLVGASFGFRGAKIAVEEEGGIKREHLDFRDESK